MFSNSVCLSNGLSIPLLGLGTLQAKAGEVEIAVEEALKAGYRHIDCAFIYGNEKEVGMGIKASGVAREDIFVTSKLWITRLKPDMVETECRNTLGDLGLAYLDLYLIHWPCAMISCDSQGQDAVFDTSFTLLDTWKAMEKLVTLGLVKSIGVSNFNSDQLENICKNGSIKPVTNQVECHPFFNQSKLLAFCKERDVTLTAYSPLARALSGPKHGELGLLEQPKLQSIAEKYSKTAAQVALRWNIQRGIITIPKSVTASRIVENCQIFDFNLTDEEMREVDSLDCSERIFNPQNWKDHPEYPFHKQF